MVSQKATSSEISLSNCGMQRKLASEFEQLFATWPNGRCQILLTSVADIKTGIGHNHDGKLLRKSGININDDLSSLHFRWLNQDLKILFTLIITLGIL